MEDSPMSIFFSKLLVCTQHYALVSLWFPARSCDKIHKDMHLLSCVIRNLQLHFKKKKNPVLIFLIHTEKVTCQVYNPMSLHRLSSLSTSFLPPSRPAHCSRHSDFLRATIANLKKKIFIMDNSQTCTGQREQRNEFPCNFQQLQKVLGFCHSCFIFSLFSFQIGMQVYR